MVGRKPKPRALKLAEGTFRKDRARNEPQPGPGIPSCPSWLDAEAKAEWKRILPQLGVMGLSTKVDRAALAGYCQSWSDYKAAVQAVRKDGKTFKSPHGYICKNPMVTIMNEAWDRVHKAAQQFGFTPSARSRINVPEPKPADDFEKFLRKPG